MSSYQFNQRQHRKVSRFARMLAAATVCVSVFANTPLFASTVSANTPGQAISSTGSFVGMDAALSTPGLVQQLNGLGVAWTRRPLLSWARVEPSEGARNWAAVSALENDLNIAAKNKLKVLLLVRDTPDWAQARPNTACGPVRADKFAAFGTFLRDAVARYSKAPFNVVHFEIGNEPDVDPAVVPGNSGFGCWGNPADPYFGGGVYGEMLKVIHPQLKAGSAKAQLLVGGLLLDCDPNSPPAGRDCRESRFLEGILQAGGGPFFDAVSFHAYDFYGFAERVYVNPGWGAAWNTTGPVVTQKAQFLRDVMAKFGVSKPLMASEIAVICWDCAATPPEFERTKANYVPQSMAAAKAAGVINAVWFCWEGWFGSGMLDIAGQPTAALTAFRVASAALGRAVFVRERSDLPNAQVYEFRRGGTKFVVAWPRAGEPVQVALPFSPTRITNALGEQQPLSKTLTLSSPLYIEFR
jgi:hypothetical protein